MIRETATLQEFQLFNKELYELVDDRNYSSLDLLSYLLRHVTKLLKAVRKQKHDTVSYHLCMALSWTLATANRMHIEVSSEMWIRFPNLCPYCSSRPCSCRERTSERKKVDELSEATPPTTLFEWQRMFHEIYPNNTVQDSVVHLVEEVGELNEAIRNYLSTHREGSFEKITEELVDVFANLFALAHCLGLDLGKESVGYFRNGCPKCQRFPCGCEYVLIDEPI